MRLTINVTEDEISSGDPRGGASCPVALAVKKAGLKLPSVGNYTLGYWEDGVQHIVPLPESASDFIRRFDRLNCDARPFSFEIEVPNA